MPSGTWEAADRAFYEWLHVSGEDMVSLPVQRKIFMAGWNAHIEQGGDDE